MICTKHPHSSARTAERCFAKAARSKSARLARHYFAPPPAVYQRFDPPAVEVKGGVLVWWFYGRA